MGLSRSLDENLRLRLVYIDLKWASSTRYYLEVLGFFPPEMPFELQRLSEFCHILTIDLNLVASRL